jgi:hypothetical protein
MSSYEYNQLLKFLYFEGYADSYAEAEELLESMSDEEFEDLLERKYDKDEPLPGSGKTPSQKMERKRSQHGARVLLGNPALGRNRRSDPESDSYRERASTIDTVKKAQDAGEEPRDNPAFKNTIAARRRPRASYEVPNERPGGLRAKATKAGGYRTLTRKEELEMQEAWYSGAGSYRTTASGRKVRRDEDEATDTAVSDMLQKRREAAAKKAAQQKLKTQGLKRKDGTSVFEEVAEYLFVEGYADTIEGAEVMAENISENWVNEIMEKFDPKDYKEYHQNNHRDKRNPSDEWDAQEKDWQDSRGDIRDKHNMKRGVKNKKGSKDINEKHVKALDTTGRGADRRTRFPKFKGKDDEFDPKFTQQRVNRNDKKIDPYFSGRRERKSARRQGTGGFNAE